MRTDDEWYSSIGYDDNHHAFGGGREFVLKCIRAIQRDAIEAAAKVCDPQLVEMTAVLHPTGGPTMMLKTYNTKTGEQCAAAIRALLPPAGEITAEKPEGR